MRVRSEPWLVFVALAGLGCPAPVVPTEPGSGESTSTATGGSSDGPGATSLASDTTSDGTGHDTTAGTTTSSSTGTTAGGADFGEVSDGPVCHQCCGNGAIDGTELCDCGGEFCTPAGLNFAECAELTNPLFPDRIYTGGVLDCAPASCKYNFDQCGWCGDTVIGEGENCEPDRPSTDTCESLGLGPGSDPLPCSEHCQLDTSSCVE